MNLNDLIKSAEEKLTNHDLTIGARLREEAILHHLTNLERTVTELESQNTELYVDLCEMGDMARERSRKRTNEDEIPDWRYGNLCYRHHSMIGIDLGDGESFTPEVE